MTNLATTLKPMERPNSTEVLNSPHLKRVQRIHAQAVVALSSLGLMRAAILLIWGPPISAIDVGIFFGMFVSVGIGTSVGFHRLFSHRSFKTTKAVRVALAILGSMAMQGTVIFWASQHRRHHAHTDAPGDPHSPYVNEQGEKHKSFLSGLWHSYMGWTFNHEVPNATYYAKDLLRDQAISRVNRYYFLWIGLGLLIPSILGGVLHQSWIGALSGLVWGGLIRISLWHNMIWSITSIAHIYGSRDFNSGDRSTNNFLLAIPTLGESLHNNHHAFPYAAVLCFKWWQIDLSGLLILTLQRLGLAWDVSFPTNDMRDKKRAARSGN